MVKTSSIYYNKDKLLFAGSETGMIELDENSIAAKEDWDQEKSLELELKKESLY